MRLNTFLDLCSGIGGGRLGLERSGMKSVGYSDTSRLSVTTYKLLFGAEDEKNYYYIDSIDGNDANSGLTEAEAVKNKNI